MIHASLPLCFAFFLGTGIPVAQENKGAENAWFVDQNLVYERGSALSARYLKTKAPEFSRKIPTILPWIVRIEVQHTIKKDGYQSNHGTGVILRGGKVLTAKHVLTKNVKDPNGKTKILLTTPDGRVFRATVKKKGSKDWVVLKIDLDANQSAMLRSPVRLAKPKQGETAVFIGYPARLGLDDHGKVQSFNKGNKKKNIPVSQLDPMIVVGAVQDLKAMNLRTIAGFPPVGGMSGGPVFNLKGELIAVQHSVATTTLNATGKVLHYTIETTSSNDITP